MFWLNVLHHRRTHYMHIKSHESRQTLNFLKLGVPIPSILVCIEVWRDDIGNEAEIFMYHYFYCSGVTYKF